MENLRAFRASVDGVDEQGRAITYAYDTCCGSLTNISYSDNTPSVSYTYDRLGRQVTVTDAQGTRTNVYDAATLALVEEQLPDGTVLERSQDTFGRASGFTVATGAQPVDYSVTYGYDTVGRFHSVSSSVSSVSSVVNYSYLPDSSLISGYTAGDLTVSRSYEPNRNLITDIENMAGTNLISRFAYENDAIGRRTLRVDNASITNNFGYNIRSEVIEALMGTNTYGYAYDPIGNRLSEVSDLISEVSTNLYTANELNQYTAITNFSSQVSSFIPQYDSDGNLISYNGWTFTWNGENRLIAASNTTTVIENAYDYMGRRISKVVDGVTHTFVYDGWAMIREQSPTTTNSYVYGLDLSSSMQGAGTIGGILTAVFGSDTEPVEVYYCYDANGNVTDLVGTNGTTVAHYEYGPFGQTTIKTGSLADVNPFQFSTKYLDTETSLYYYGLRYYNPELGRWIKRDPIKEGGGVNIYGFVGNQSVIAVDYLGLESICRMYWFIGHGPSRAGNGSWLQDTVDAWKDLVHPENDRIAPFGCKSGAIDTSPATKMQDFDWEEDLDIVFDGVFVDEVLLSRIYKIGPKLRANWKRAVDAQEKEVKELCKCCSKIHKSIRCQHKKGEVTEADPIISVLIGLLHNYQGKHPDPMRPGHYAKFNGEVGIEGPEKVCGSHQIYDCESNSWGPRSPLPGGNEPTE